MTDSAASSLIRQFARIDAGNVNEIEAFIGIVRSCREWVKVNETAPPTRRYKQLPKVKSYKHLTRWQRLIYLRLLNRISEMGDMEITLSWAEMKQVLLGCGRTDTVTYMVERSSHNREYEVPAVVLESMINIAVEGRLTV